MTTTGAARFPLADASAFRSVRGWPSWAVIVLALVLTLGGTAVDGLSTGALAWGLRIGFYAGVVLAAILVRRASIFTAMVQPPLVVVIGIVVGGMLFTNTGGLYATALKIIGTFPTMAIGTSAAVLIGLIRILAQPLRSATRSAVHTPASHA